jgi:hypothetical protein
MSNKSDSDLKDIVQFISLFFIAFQVLTIYALKDGKEWNELLSISKVSLMFLSLLLFVQIAAHVAVLVSNENAVSSAIALGGTLLGDAGSREESAEHKPLNKEDSLENSVP